jgi:hypothetical protein
MTDIENIAEPYAEPYAFNKAEKIADEEKEPEEVGTWNLPRGLGENEFSGLIGGDDGSDEDDKRLAVEEKAYDRDTVYPTSLMEEEEQQSVARDRDKTARDGLLDQKQEERPEEQSRLPRKTISFIITEPIFSSSSNVGAAMIFLKLTLYGLAYYNASVQPDPVALSLEVMITQALAIFVASFTQVDVATAVQLFHEGHASVKDRFDSVKPSVWYAAAFLAFLQGCFGLAAIFEFITVSRTVLDVFLNFAAVAFVMTLDGVAFQLASHGFLGESCQSSTQKVSGTYFQVTHTPFAIKVPRTSFQVSLNLKFGYIKKIVLLVGIWAMMFGFWLWVIIRQQNGFYAPKQLVVQFDDSVVPKLGAFSGIYTLKKTRRALSSDLFHWKQEVPGQGDIGEFGFCKADNRWSFFLHGTRMCNDSIVESNPNAEKFEVLRVADLQWFVRGDSGLVQNRLISMDGFTVAPICVIGGTACGRQSKINTCKPEKKSDSTIGYCKCQDQQTYGVRCEFSLANTCLHLKVDDRFGMLPTGRRITSEFSLLLKNGILGKDDETPAMRDDLVLLYKRPVYVGKSFGQEGYDVLFYTGLRWAVTGSLTGFPELCGDKENVTALAIFLQNSTKGFNAGFNGTVAKVDVLSEPVSSGSQKDSGTPVGLTWVSLEQAAPMDTVKLLNGEKSFASLLCAGCNNSTNPCHNEGLCNTTSQTCDCKHGAKGALCQVQPIGDGSCNPFFNTPSFSYDGGDCCESTCSPSSPYYCGTINEGDLDKTFNLRSEDNFVFMGFPNCSDPAIVGDCSNETGCWAKGSEFMIGTPDESDAYIFSANGHMLLVYRRFTSYLAVFDKESSGQWVQRGSDILLMFPHVWQIHFDDDPPNARLLNFITLPSELYGNDERSHVPVWVVFISIEKITMFVEWDLQSRSWKEYALPVDLAGCVGLNISRSTSYLDLQAERYTVSDGETSCLYTNMTADEQRNFTLHRRINGTSLESNLVDVNNQTGVTMNECLIMVWNTTSVRVIDYTTQDWDWADVTLPKKCTDDLRSVHLSGRSTRYRYEDDPNQVSRVALECHKNSSIYVYVFTINSEFAPDEFTKQPFASLEPLPVPTGEGFESLAFSDSLLALVYSTDSSTRVYVYNGTGSEDEEAIFQSFGSTFPRAGNIYVSDDGLSFFMNGTVSDDGLSFFMNGTQKIEVYTTSPRCDSETQVSLILTTQTTRETPDRPTFFTVEGRNASSSVTWRNESKGVSGGSGVGAGTILQNEFCINKDKLDHIRVIVNFHRAPSALLNRREVTLNLVEGPMYKISSADVLEAKQ